MTDKPTDIDVDIAQAWPDKWARANNPTFRNRSKARNNLRKAWRRHLALADFSAANPSAKCGNCAHRAVAANMGGRHHCEMESDFHGYAMIDDLGAVCVKWKSERDA